MILHLAELEFFLKESAQEEYSVLSTAVADIAVAPSPIRDSTPCRPKGFLSVLCTFLECLFSAD